MSVKKIFAVINIVNAIVLVSRNNGKIYISVHTEKLNELLDLIEPHIVKNNEKNE